MGVQLAIFKKKSRECKRTWRARYVSAEDNLFTLGVRKRRRPEETI
jgi:hypothetical protein